MKQLYIVRKYIMAKSAQDAIRKDKLAPINDIWLDEEWKKNQLLTTNQMGYTACKGKKKQK